MLSLLVFVLGTCIGSFIPCLAHQLVYQHFAWTARSVCDHCHHPLAWYDLVPILSQWALHGRCRYCRQRLSPLYWRVEALTGLLALGLWQTAQRQAWSGLTLVYLTLICTLLGLMAACDCLATWVPDRLHLLMLPWTLLMSGQLGWSWAKVLVLVLAVGGLVLIQWGRPDWMGGADTKLLASLWLSLPLPSFPYLLGLAALVGLVGVLLRGRSRWHHPLPFIPAIGLAYYLLVVAGPWLGL